MLFSYYLALLIPLVSTREVSTLGDSGRLVKRQFPDEEEARCGTKEIKATVISTWTVSSGRSCRLKCSSICAAFFYDASVRTANCVLFRSSRIGKSVLQVNGKAVCLWSRTGRQTRTLPVLEKCTVESTLYGTVMGSQKFVTSSEVCKTNCKNNDGCSHALIRLSEDNDIVCRLFKADPKIKTPFKLAKNENACPVGEIEPEEVDDTDYPDTTPGVDFENCNVGNLEGYYLGPKKAVTKRTLCMDLCNQDINCSHMITRPIPGNKYECGLFRGKKSPVDREVYGYSENEGSKSCARTKSHGKITQEVLKRQGRPTNGGNCGQWDLALADAENVVSVADNDVDPTDDTCMARCNGDCEISYLMKPVDGSASGCIYLKWRNAPDYVTRRMTYSPEEVLCSKVIKGPATKKVTNRSCGQKKLIGEVYKTLSSLLVNIPDEKACLALCKKETREECYYAIFHYAPPGFKANSCKFFTDYHYIIGRGNDQPYAFMANEVACPRYKEGEEPWRAEYPRIGLL